MTDAQLKKLAKENNFEPTYELLTFARLVLINAKIQDLKLVAINTRLAVQKEREACAKLVEAELEKIIEGCGFVKEEKNIHKDAKDLATLIRKDCFTISKALRNRLKEKNT